MIVRGLLSVTLIKTPLNTCLTESLHLPNLRGMIVKPAKGLILPVNVFFNFSSLLADLVELLSELSLSRKKREMSLRPRVKPNYKRYNWPSIVLSIIVSSAISALVFFLLSSVSSPQELVITLTASAFLLFSGAFLSLSIKYHLAVEFVNSIDVEEWAYDRGIAIVKPLRGPLTILDLKNYDLYFLKNCSISSSSPLRESERRGLRVTAFSLVLKRGDRSFEFEVKVLKEFIEAPSIKSEREVIRAFEPFLKFSLGSWPSSSEEDPSRTQKYFRELMRGVEELKIEDLE